MPNDPEAAMQNAMTIGQRAALAGVRSMVVGRAPHAVLFVGPPSSGKTTLAFDLAAGLLCNAPDPADRPCRACRGCRQVESGNHPDLHRLMPDGPGGQIKIGRASDPEPGTVRHLVSALALLPVEAGARVAIVEAAHRMNEEAQNALLKTLEEPPSGVTIVLCADDDERLLPTVRSRCVRLRLGTVASREIEAWLAGAGVADPPDAARAARLADGRPGLALAYATSPDAFRFRGELSRGLLDMIGATRRVRLTDVRALMTTAAALNAALSAARSNVQAPGETRSEAVDQPSRKGRKGRGAASEGGSEGDAGERRTGPSAADRRGAAATLFEVWASVGRDLALATTDGARAVADAELLDELTETAKSLETEALVAFLRRLTEVAALLEENVNPELALDVLALAWPRPRAAAVAGSRARSATEVPPARSAATGATAS